MKPTRRHPIRGKTILLALLLASQAAAHARMRECSPINLYESPSNPLWEIPITDQGPLYDCYAITAAQMIDYHYLSRGLPRPAGGASDLWIAYAHKALGRFPRRLIQWNRRELSFSYLKWALEDARKNGLCRKDAIDAAISRLKPDSRLTDHELLYLFGEVWRSQSRLDPTDRASLERFLAELNPEVERLARMGILADAVASIHARIRSIPGEKDERSALPYLGETLFKECAGSDRVGIELPPLTARAHGYPSDGKVLSHLDEALERTGPQPVAIGYCAEVYWEEASPDGSRMPWLPRALRTLSPECAPHYSLVAGRRRGSDGSCQYLVRNSYGTGFWTRKWECVCAQPDRTLFACSEATHRNQSVEVLGCWADEKTLGPGIFDVEAFE